MEIGERQVKERKKIQDAVFLKVEFPEATWSEEQSFRDIYQNHLDAQMKKNVDTALELLAEKTHDVYPESIKLAVPLRKLVYTYFGVKSRGNEGVEMDILSELVDNLKRRSIKPNEVENAVLESIEQIKWELPKIEYLTINADGETRWKPAEDISSAKGEGIFYSEQVRGVRISDTGNGYDPRLKSIFDPSKDENPEAAGKFGEGAKMSDAYLKLNGYKVVSRSAYSYTDESGKHNMIWKARPEVEDGNVVIKGVEVEVAGEAGLGSSTEIYLPEDPSPETKKVWDPRVARLAKQILWHGENEKSSIYYPGMMDNDNVIGINRSLKDPDYVQGIRVDVAKETVKLAFSYVTWSKEVLDSRDRIKYSEQYLKQIDKLWILGMDEVMAKMLIDANFKYELDPKCLEVIQANVVLGRNDPLSKESGRHVDKWKRTLAKAFIDYCDIKPESNYVFVNNPQNLSPEDRASLKQLIKYGFKVLQLRNLKLDNKFFSKYTGGNIYDLKGASKFLDKEASVRLSDEQQKSVEEVTERTNALKLDLIELLTENGMSVSKIRDLKLRVVSGELFEDSVFGWVTDPDTHQQVLCVNSDSYLSRIDLAETDRYFQVQLMSAQATGKFSPINHVDGQYGIQRLLDTLAKSVIPHDIGEVKYRSSFDSEGYLRDLEERELKHTEMETKIYKNLISPSPSIEDLQSTDEYFINNPESNLYYVAVSNVYKVEDTFYRFQKDDNDVCKLIKSDFETLPDIGEVNGKRIRRFGPFALFETPKAKSIKCNGATVFWSGGKIFRQDAFSSLRYEQDNIYGLTFGNEYGYFLDRDYDDEQMIEALKVRMSDLTFFSDRERGSQQTELKSGKHKTPLSTEYGKDNWDNPIRFFEDIVQNYLNAGNLTIKFLVRDTDGIESWVSGDEVSESVLIKGLRFSDDGPGYAPENLQYLGSGDKKSPVELGKYGEGLKMILAAGARNQVDIEIKSYCKSDEEDISWTARAVGVPERVVKNGKPTEVKMVGFDLNIETGKVLPGSEMTVIFDDQRSDFYKRCIEVCDPRLGDQHKGLARYVRKLRTSESKVSSTGPVTILIDPSEYGKVYENGLLVAEYPDHTWFLGGYDLPSVTSTRERNDIDWSDFAGYIKFYIYNTEDDGVIERLADLFDPVKSYATITETLDGFADLEVAAYKYGNTHANSAAKIRRAIRNKYGNLFLSTKLPEDLPSVLQGKRYIRYQPSENIFGHINLLEKILPTEETAVRELLTEKVEIDSDSKDKVMKIFDVLANKLSSSATELSLDRSRRQEVLMKFRNPELREQLISFSRISQNHYGLAYHGTDGISINESALEEKEKLPGTVLHELAHHWNIESDYRLGFMADLLDMAFYLNSLQSR